MKQEEPITSTEISQDEWEEKFKPIQNTISNREEWNGWMFETYGKDEEFINELRKTAPNRIWTVLTGLPLGDTIAQGYHYVDRFCYFVTEVEADSKKEVFVLTEGTKERGLDEDDLKKLPAFAKHILEKFEKELKDEDESISEEENNYDHLKEQIEQYEIGQQQDIEYLFATLVQLLSGGCNTDFDFEWQEYTKKK